MATRDQQPSTYIKLILLLFLLLPPTTHAQAQAVDGKPYNVSAVFVFGDSTVDPGNNNYLATPLKSNFPPYGRDFPFHKPTGRFTNGRLPTDFIASYLGIKDEVPPYLDRSLSVEELMTGVSFASAGSGFDPLTAQLTGVIPMSQQLIYFGECLTRIELSIGKNRSEDIIKKALFIISAGTNDFIANYIPLPFRRQRFSLEDYQSFLIQMVKEFLQGLRNLGAHKIAMVGLPPIGCLPIVITLNMTDGFQDRGCIEAFNSIAINFNKKLLVELQNNSNIDGGQIVYLESYKPFVSSVLSPIKYGFDELSSGCCGTGLIEAALLCNLNSLVCPDASKYVFWDAIHPTEKTYLIIFNSFTTAIDRLLKN